MESHNFSCLQARNNQSDFWELPIAIDVTLTVNEVQKGVLSSLAFSMHIDGNFSKLLHIEIRLILKMREQNIENSVLKMNSN